MKLYENRNQKSHFTCGYCHENGHRINHCPTLKAHYDQDQRGESIDMSLMKRLIQWYGANSTNLRMGFLLDGQKIVVGDRNHSPKLFHFDVSRNERDYVGLEHGIQGSSYWDNGLITEIVSPAPNIMSQEWFDGEFEPIDWVMKKRNGKDLWSYLGSYVKSFYPHADKDKKINAFKKSIGLPC
jgi:hypothetical protein